jgi:hypothetical protein
MKTCIKGLKPFHFFLSPFEFHKDTSSNLYKKIDTLRTWNYVAAALHLGAAVYTSVSLKNRSRRIVDVFRLQFDETQPQSESRVDIPVKIQTQDRVDLKILVVAFFIVTSIAHFLYATDFLGRGWYSSQVLGFGWNPYRWVEYSISAGLMIYLISIASGTKEQISAISNALITPGLMVNGFTNERALQQNALHDWSLKPETTRPKVDALIVWSNIIPAWILFFVHWFVILSNYSKLSKEAKDEDKPLDKSVGFMVYSQLLFFSLFGVIQTYQVFRWRTLKPGRIEPSFIVYEKVYIVLSAITKLLLAGTIVFALRDN